MGLRESKYCLIQPTADIENALSQCIFSVRLDEISPNPLRACLLATHRNQKKKKEKNKGKQGLSNLPPPPSNLHRHIPHRTHPPQRHQSPPDPAIHPPLIQRHGEQQAQQRHQQRDPADDQRAADLDRIRLVLDLAAGMPLAPLAAPGDGHVQAADADAEQDVEHGSAEAGAQGHDRVAEAGDGDVGDEVAERVADGEDGEAEDGVRDAEDDAEGFEHADDFVGDGGDPGDGDGEAEEAEERAVGWRLGWGGQGEEEEERDGGG